MFTVKNCWASLSQSQAVCANLRGLYPLGAKIWSSEKVLFGCVLTHTLFLVDQGSPGFFHWTQGWKDFPILNISYLFWRYLRSKSKFSKIAPNFARFWPHFWGVKAPEFLDLDYKIQPTSDHVAKFHANRPSEIGDLRTKLIQKTCMMMQYTNWIRVIKAYKVQTVKLTLYKYTSWWHVLCEMKLDYKRSSSVISSC